MTVNPRIQVTKKPCLEEAIATIQRHRPGLITDTLVVTYALVDLAQRLEGEKTTLDQLESLVDRLTVTQEP